MSGEEEPTVEKSTDELLSETDDLLAGLEEDDGESGGSSSRDSEGADAGVDEAMGDLEADVGSGARERPQATPDASTVTEDSRGFRTYFDPTSAGISAILVLGGAVLGGVVPIPILGQLAGLLGVGAATFVHGLGAGDSRYVETFVASGLVGFLYALVTTNLFITLSGVGVPVLALSTAVTMLVALLGHYFGRDLRDGLTRDVGGGGSGGDDDVPGW